MSRLEFEPGMRGIPTGIESPRLRFVKREVERPVGDGSQKATFKQQILQAWAWDSDLGTWHWTDIPLEVESESD